jgi:hypothetical protein
MRTRKPWVVVLLLAISPAFASDGPVTIVDFEKDPVGAIAEGYTTVGEWKIVSTDEGKVLAQLAKSPDAAFNVALIDSSFRAKDVDLSVKIKAIAGENDRGGGLVWRARDTKNYYIARYNHLEDNFRVYKVVDGKRSAPFQNADIKHHDGWTVVRVRMKGDHIECYVDGKKYLDVHDSTFPDAGKIGFWSKSDAQTQFDSLTIDHGD